MSCGANRASPKLLKMSLNSTAVERAGAAPSRAAPAVPLPASTGGGLAASTGGSVHNGPARDAAAAPPPAPPTRASLARRLTRASRKKTALFSVNTVSRRVCARRVAMRRSGLDPEQSNMAATATGANTAAMGFRVLLAPMRRHGGRTPGAFGVATHQRNESFCVFREPDDPREEKLSANAAGARPSPH